MLPCRKWLMHINFRRTFCKLTVKCKLTWMRFEDEAVYFPFFCAKYKWHSQEIDLRFRYMHELTPNGPQNLNMYIYTCEIGYTETGLNSTSNLLPKGKRYRNKSACSIASRGSLAGGQDYEIHKMERPPSLLTTKCQKAQSRVWFRDGEREAKHAYITFYAISFTSGTNPTEHLQLALNNCGIRPIIYNDCRWNLGHQVLR